MYAYFTKELQKSYTLMIKDGHNNFNLGDKEFREIFVRPRSSTLINKCREFQFMLLHGAVYTKEQLKNFNFVTDNLCSFDQHEPETYVHLFLNCGKVNRYGNFQEIASEMGQLLLVLP